MNTKAYEKLEVARGSGDLRRLALYHFSRKEFSESITSIRQAVAVNPQDWQCWIAAVEIFEKGNASVADWKEFHQDVLAHLSGVSSGICYDYLKRVLS